MTKTRSVLTVFGVAALATLTVALGAQQARAQSAAQEQYSPAPTASDYAAAQESTLVYRHARAANTKAAAALKNKEVLTKRETPRRAASQEAGAAASSTSALRYPGDLTYFGGKVVDSAESHAIYMLPNGVCPIATCWGNPEGFLKDLGQSDLIDVVNQYVGLFSTNRYTVGASARINYTPTKVPLTDHDLVVRLHVEASRMGSGYGHIYHFFLPKGQDICFTATDGVCYSPDNDNTFAFCGYHSSVDFPDAVGHVLYSVEPFQNVPGCSVKPGTPNGQLVDSTNNTLSHEVIETITDPDGDAWFNFTSVPLAGQEIADECSFFVFIPPSSVFFDPSPITANGHHYAVQPEYSNLAHACSVGR
jgi:hypothetical protein